MGFVRYALFGRLGSQGHPMSDVAYVKQWFADCYRFWVDVWNVIRAR